MPRKPWKKVLLCGDRDWSDGELIETAILRLKAQGYTLVIEGGARGADLLAGAIARKHGIIVAQVDALWDYQHAAAGPIRNSAMLQLGPDLVVAFHDHLDTSSGTLDMVKKAVKANIPVEVISHPGEGGSSEAQDSGVPANDQPW